jgi:hypothetical protein
VLSRPIKDVGNLLMPFTRSGNHQVLGSPINETRSESSAYMQIILVVLQVRMENLKKMIEKSLVWNPVTKCAWVHMKGVPEFCWFIRERKEYFVFPPISNSNTLVLKHLENWF